MVVIGRPTGYRLSRLLLGFVLSAIGAQSIAEHPAPIAHILRLRLPDGASQSDRAAAFVTANRFKQIRSTSFFVVGRDVSAADNIALVQISTFTDEQRYRDYFYDPIHLAVDRAGDEAQ